MPYIVGIVEFLPNQKFSGTVDEPFVVKFRLPDETLLSLAPTAHIALTKQQPGCQPSVELSDDNIFSIHIPAHSLVAGSYEFNLTITSGVDGSQLFTENFRFSMFLPDTAIVRGVGVEGLIGPTRTVSSSGGGGGGSKNGTRMTSLTTATTANSILALTLGAVATQLNATNISTVDLQKSSVFIDNTSSQTTNQNNHNTNQAGTQTTEAEEEEESELHHHGHQGHHEQHGATLAQQIEQRDGPGITPDKKPAPSEPPIAEPDAVSITEDANELVNVLVNDRDPDTGDVLTVTDAKIINGGLGTVTIVNNQILYDPTSVYQFLSQEDHAIVIIEYTVTDSSGLSDSTEVTILVQGVNDAPDAVADTVATTENTALVIDALANDTDVDSNDGPTNFSLDGVTNPAGQGSVNVNANQINFDPGTDFDYLDQGSVLNYTIQYQMSDDSSASSNSNVTIQITGVNDTPVAIADTAMLTEDQTSTTNVLANDTDVDQSDNASNFILDSVTNLGVITPVGSVSGVIGNVSVVGNQLFFNPGSAFQALDAGASVELTVQYTMEDTQGASSVSTVTITVTGQNDAPIAVADIGAVTQNLNTTLNVLANDTDVDDGDNPVNFTLVNVNIVGGLGTANVVGNELVFNTGNDFNFLGLGETRIVTVNQTISDDSGTQSTTAANITVTGVNDGPIAVDDVANLTENQTLTIDALANDSDIDQNDVLSIESFNNTSGFGSISEVNGELVFNPGASFDSLNQGQTQNFSFTYTIEDNHGATSTATINAQVTGENDVPVAVNDVGGTVVEGSLGIFTVLLNDTDIDSAHDFSNFGITNFSITGGLGELAIVKFATINAIEFKTNSDYDFLAENEIQSVEITYQAEDLLGASSNTATLTTSVTGVNDAPVLLASGNAVNHSGSAVVVDSGIGLSDVDVSQNTITGAVIQVVEETSDTLVTGDILSAGTLLNGVTASFNATTNELTLTGNATVAEYATMLQDVSFDTTSGMLSTRSVSFSVTDSGSSNETSNVENVSITLSDANELIQESLEQTETGMLSKIIGKVKSGMASLLPAKLEEQPEESWADYELRMIQEKQAKMIEIGYDSHPELDTMKLPDIGSLHDKKVAAAKRGFEFLDEYGSFVKGMPSETFDDVVLALTEGKLLLGLEKQNYQDYLMTNNFQTLTELQQRDSRVLHDHYDQAAMTSVQKASLAAMDSISASSALTVDESLDPTLYKTSSSIFS